MMKTIRIWLSLALCAVLAFSACAAPAEEADSAQDLCNRGMEAYAANDRAAAAEYFRQAADAGSGEAMNALGIMYLYALGVEQSDEKALEYWQRGAGAGNAIAMVNLASCYSNGDIVERSYETAAEYLLKAADLGNDMAMARLGTLYESGEGVEQSPETAVEYYRRAAEMGNGLAQFSLGLCYYKGTGTELSFEKAMEYFRAAAGQDDDLLSKGNALACLAMMYENGEGTEQSYGQAAEYYSAAAELGISFAQFRLGRLYQEGLGVEQSAEKAAEYYSLAASASDSGGEDARQALAAMAETGNHGLAPSDGIVIPDYTQETVREFEFPQATPALEFVRNLKAGWNLGNTFDAYYQGGSRPQDYETYWSGAKTTRALIHAVREAGFNLLRIPVSWHDHLTDTNHTIDPAWLDRVEEVAGWALEEDMYVIINIHHDNSPEYLYPDSAHYEQSEKYLTDIWSQVAARFAEYDEHLIFESMNEPRLIGTEYEWDWDPEDPVYQDAADCINRLNRKFVETVRAAGGRNADRFLMVPGYCGSYEGAAADEFELPEDGRLIVEAHMYVPYDFALNTESDDSSFDLEKDGWKKNEIASMFTGLYERHIVRGVPVIVDEFGALRKNDGDLQARVNFAAFFAAMASARGIPVAWWDNANFVWQGEQFGLIDRNRLQWVYPDIALAIITNCMVNR